jgi:putative endonuclease
LVRAQEGEQNPNQQWLGFFVLNSFVMHLVYILYSQKINRFYIGYTANLDLRLGFHLNDNQTRKFTYKADDWEFQFSIECDAKQQALLIEKHIKAMKSKVYIKNLIKYPEMRIRLIEKYKE